MLSSILLLWNLCALQIALQFSNEILNLGSLWNWQSRHRVERIWAKCWHHLSSRASQSILLMVSSNQFWLSWLRISDQWFTMAHEQYTGAFINFIWLGAVHKRRRFKISWVHKVNALSINYSHYVFNFQKQQVLTAIKVRSNI